MSGPASEPSAVGAARTDRQGAVRRDGSGPTSAPNPPGLSWSVRPATHGDVPSVVEAVRALLRELGGTPPPTPAMQAAARALLDSSQAGALFVAEAGGALVGVLGVSWQTAIHIPGRYALIQDLWVDPSWRGRAVGRGLLAALFERSRELALTRAEVGLPREDYAGLRATEAFYRAAGFTPLGARLRRLLP